MDWSVRLAREEDVSAIAALIPLSVRGLQADYYSTEQMKGALEAVFGVDQQLIRDGTYFVAEIKTTNAIIGCGGWSKRKTLFGSDHQTNRDDTELDPARESARVRAFFVHPDWARRGIARAVLCECESAVRAAGFRSVELAATLPGVPFYTAFGYAAGPERSVALPNGSRLRIVPMSKAL